ncbi:hypothetical protein EDB19DRAFT_1828094 [Suillus lakei]|nr:hypothetical protein EDB19DRAFT_1828094 [Suillus lakei]
MARRSAFGAQIVAYTVISINFASNRPSSGSLVARQQGNYLPKAFGDPAGSNSTAATSTPMNSSTSAFADSRTCHFTWPRCRSFPIRCLSGGHTFGDAGPTAFETLTGTPAGNDTPGTPADLAGSTPSEHAAETTTPADNNASHDTNASETPQSDSYTFDTPFTATFQGVTVDVSSPFVESDASSIFRGASGIISDALNRLGDAVVFQEENPVDIDAVVMQINAVQPHPYYTTNCELSIRPASGVHEACVTCLRIMSSRRVILAAKLPELINH